MAGKICVGAIFRKWDDNANHFKFHIIVGDISGQLAVIFVNTDARYSNLPAQLQGNQIPISPEVFSFLDHESFIDCSSIQEIEKGKINEYLQVNSGHHCGHVPQPLIDNIIRTLTYSKVVEIWKKEKYGFIPK